MSKKFCCWNQIIESRKNERWVRIKKYFESFWSIWMRSQVLENLPGSSFRSGFDILPGQGPRLSRDLHLDPDIEYWGRKRRHAVLRKGWVCFHCCSPTSRGWKPLPQWMRSVCPGRCLRISSARYWKFPRPVEGPTTLWRLLDGGGTHQRQVGSGFFQEVVVKARFHQPASAAPGIQHPVLLFPCKN